MQSYNPIKTGGREREREREKEGDREYVYIKYVDRLQKEKNSNWATKKKIL